MQYRKAIDREKIKQRHKWTKVKAKCIVQFILLDEKDARTKQKILSVLRQKHQVVHDHYSFESLKTMEVQQWSSCPKFVPSKMEVALCCLPLSLQFDHVYR